MLLKLATLSLLVCGCGESTGRLAFSGRVERDGRPVARGSISFLPAEGHAGGPAANTAIADGHYHFDTDTGPMPGPHNVIVSAQAGQAGLKSAGSTATVAPTRRDFHVDVDESLDFQTDFELSGP